MQISVLQIAQPGLNNAIANTISGANFSGILQAYVNASGYLGNQVVYITGDQDINGIKNYLVSPLVPFVTNTGGAINLNQVLSLITGSIQSYSGYGDGFLVHRVGDESISGNKSFLTSISVPNPSNTGNAVNLLYLSVVSGILQTEINNVNPQGVAHLTGTETFVGQKTFLLSPLVPIPTNDSGAVPLGYLSTLNLTGVAYVNQPNTFTQANTFTVSPTIPIGVASNAPVTVAQLNAAVIAGGSTGNGSVTSVNGISGNVFIDGAGTVTVYECSGIIIVSGHSANNTQLYASKIPMSSGVTGLQWIFGTGFSLNPTVVGNLELSGNSSISFIKHTVYGTTTSGFNVAFESGMPSSNYLFDVNVIPFSSGQSGFMGIQGAAGRNGLSPNARGAWQQGVFYNPLDYTFTSPLFTSFICTSGHVSTLSNIPTSTGNGVWQIFSSGQQGATGFWHWRGNFDINSSYSYQDGLFSSGESFGFTGSFISGVYPQTLTGGWTYIAQKGAIGSYINSGIVTGNFYSLSLFVDPVTSGLAVGESFIGSSFILTGYALGAVTSGAGPLIGTNAQMSGRIYSRALDNSTTTLFNFTFNSGLFPYYSGNGLAINCTGGSRIGLDITSSLSGISKFSVGVFGFGF